jgi:hypothetical protein
MIHGPAHAYTYRHVCTHVSIRLRDWSHSYEHTHWAWLQLCVYMYWHFPLFHTHTCGHISTDIEAYTLLRLRSCVHTHVDVIRLMPRYTCGMRESLGLCVHKIVGKSHMWNVGIIGLICAYPYVQDGAYVYVHENVDMIVLTCIYTWAQSNFARYYYDYYTHIQSHNTNTISQNVCSPAEGIPAPATAHKKQVAKHWSMSACTWSCIRKHIFLCKSGIVPPLGVNKRVYVYVHVWVCLHLRRIQVWGYFAYVFICVWVWSRSCVHAGRVWLCLNTTLVGVIALMSAHTSELDHTHVWVHVWTCFWWCPYTNVDVIALMCRHRIWAWLRSCVAWLCSCIHTHVCLIVLMCAYACENDHTYMNI